MYLDALDHQIKVGDLVRYTHDAESIGIVIKFESGREPDPIKVHWQRTFTHLGSEMRSGIWCVEPKHLIVIKNQKNIQIRTS